MTELSCTKKLAGGPMSDYLSGMFHVEHSKTWSDVGPIEKSKYLKKKGGPMSDQ